MLGRSPAMAILRPFTAFLVVCCAAELRGFDWWLRCRSLLLLSWFVAIFLAGAGAGGPRSVAWIRAALELVRGPELVLALALVLPVPAGYVHSYAILDCYTQNRVYHGVLKSDCRALDVLKGSAFGHSHR